MAESQTTPVKQETAESQTTPVKQETAESQTTPVKQETAQRSVSPHLDYAYITDDYVYYSNQRILRWRQREARYTRLAQLAHSTKPALGATAVVGSTAYLLYAWPRRARLFGVINAGLLPWTMPWCGRAIDDVARGLSVAAYGAKERVRECEAAHELWFAPKHPPEVEKQDTSGFGAGFVVATNAYEAQIKVDDALMC